MIVGVLSTEQRNFTPFLHGSLGENNPPLATWGSHHMVTYPGTYNGSHPMSCLSGYLAAGLVA